MGRMNACRTASEKALQELLEVLDFDKYLRSFHLSNRGDTGSGSSGSCCSSVVVTIKIQTSTAASSLPTAMHAELKSLIQVAGISPNKGREVPGGGGAGGVTKVGHVKHASAAASGEEDLLLVSRVAVGEETVDEDEGFEGDGPAASLAETAGEGGDAGVDVGAGVAGEAEDFTDVAFFGGVFVVAGGFDDGDVEVGDGGAVTDFGDAYAGLVFDGADGSPESARSHECGE